MSDAPKTQTQAGGYEARIGRYGAALSDAFIAATGIEAGRRVLDVGCGTGALTERLAAVVGPDRVASIDPGADVRVHRPPVPEPMSELLVEVWPDATGAARVDATFYPECVPAAAVTASFAAYERILRETAGG